MSKKSRERANRHADRAAGRPVAPAPARAGSVPLRMARQCGQCSACCVIFDVPDLDKKRGEPCAFLKPEADAAGMCSIWNAPLRVTDGTDQNDFATERSDAGRDPETGDVRKPQVCATFRCNWLAGLLPDNLYPAASGVVFKPTSDGKKLSCFELEPDAARRSAVADYIATVADRGVPVIVVPPAPKPGEEEGMRRVVRPPVGKNPEFDAELARLQRQNPGTFRFAQ